MNNKKLLLLLLQVISWIYLNEGGLRCETELSNCHGHPLADPKIGADLEICCTTNCPLCVEDPLLLTIQRDHDGKGEIVDISENATFTSGNVSASINLTIPFPSDNAHSGFYYCYCNTSRLDGENVHILDKMDPPSIISVTSTLKHDVTVTFDPGDFHQSYRDRYTVTVRAMLSNTDMEMCGNKTIMCQRLCTCRFMMKDLLSGYETVIMVRKERAHHRRDTNATVNLISNIKPDPIPISDIVITDVGSNSAKLKMCAPDKNEFYYVTATMEHFGSPLRMQFSVIKTQGSHETRKYNITFHEKYHFCFEMELSHLTPFTTYDVSVIASGGGGDSLPSSTSFTTSKTAPLLSPESVFYWLVEEPSNDSSTTYSINLSWKQISHDMSGGNISYRVSYYNDGNKIEDVTEPYIILRRIPDSRVAVKICSKNEMGLTDNCTHIEIEKYSKNADMYELQSHVETDDSQATVYLGKPSSNHTISAVYWCIGHEYSAWLKQVVCKKFPQMVLDGGDIKPGAHFSLKKKCQVEIMSERTQQTVIWDASESIDINKYMAENITAVQEYAKDDAFCTSDYKLETPEQHKFMFSIKGSRQLFPFRCYYDSKKTIAILDISQKADKDQVSLDWRQRCDYSSPQQFLAREFEIYTSDDDNCNQSNDTKTDTVRNSVLHRSKLKLSSGKRFSCVRAIGSKSEFTQPKKLSPWTPDESDGSGNGIIIAVIVSPVVACTVACIGVCVYCIHKRYVKAIHAFARSGKDESQISILDKTRNLDNGGYEEMETVAIHAPNDKQFPDQSSLSGKNDKDVSTSNGSDSGNEKDSDCYIVNVSNPASSKTDVALHSVIPNHSGVSRVEISSGDTGNCTGDTGNSSGDTGNGSGDTGNGSGDTGNGSSDSESDCIGSEGDSSFDSDSESGGVLSTEIQWRLMIERREQALKEQDTSGGTNGDTSL